MQQWALQDRWHSGTCRSLTVSNLSNFVETQVFKSGRRCDFLGVQLWTISQTSQTSPPKVLPSGTACGSPYILGSSLFIQLTLPCCLPCRSTSLSLPMLRHTN